MRIGTLFLSLVFVFSLITVAISQDYFVYESFDYPMGTVLDTLVGEATGGWGGSWDHFDLNDSAMYVADSNIVYDDIDYLIPSKGLQMTGGNIAAWGGQRYGRFLDKTWPNDAGLEYWLSFVMVLSPDFSQNGWAGVGLWTDATEQVNVGHEWGNDSLGLFTYSPEGHTAYKGQEGPQWYVARIIMSGDTLGQRTFLWVTPDPEGEEPDTNNADAKANWNLRNGFNRVVVHFGNEIPGARMTVDEIRLGTSWNEIAADPNALPGQKNLQPYEFDLSQNYPNPFNPTTKIEYSIHKKSKVRLVVYDLLGREIEVLVNNEQNPGKHQVVFSSANLTSGIYFYKLSADNHNMTKKMMLMK
jgi:hypothetical protein